MHKTLLLFLVTLSVVSCDFQSKGNQSGAIARVGESYLYIKDVKNMVPEGTSAADSIKIIHNYINTWASQKLVLAAAENNINDDLKADIDKLIEQYKTDLYAQSYIERIVSRSLDTIVSDDEIQALYEETKSNFKVRSKLLKLRFVVLAKSHQDLAQIKIRFSRFNSKDKEYIEQKGIQFKQFALNDDVWVDSSTLFEKFPFLTHENENEYLSSGKFIEKSDSENTYLIRIKEVLNSGEVSPFSYQRETLKDILLSRRKLKLIHSFKKEITDNAIKNEEFEIYK